MRIIKVIFLAITVFITGCATNTPSVLSSTPEVNATEEIDSSKAMTGIVTSGSFFALSVADAEESAAWYSEKLGLEVIFHPPQTDDATVIVLEGGGLTVELIQLKGAKPLSEVAPSIENVALIHGVFKVGVIVEDYANTLAFLEERNVPFFMGPFPATSEQKANVIIQDNEGNLIQFFEK